MAVMTVQNLYNYRFCIGFRHVSSIFNQFTLVFPHFHSIFKQSSLVRELSGLSAMMPTIDLFHNPETPPVTGENFPVFCQKWEKPSCLMCILKVMEHV